MKILVVDDIASNRNLLRQMLSRLGYEVLEAVSGIAAVEIVETEVVDMVLMDIMMPDMDGYEAASRIKKIAGEQYIPIIFVTALKEEDALSSALEAGGDDFITKPINFGVLESKIYAHKRIKALNGELLEKNKQLEKYNYCLQREQLLIEHFFDNATRRSEIDAAVEGNSRFLLF